MTIYSFHIVFIINDVKIICLYIYDFEENNQSNEVHGQIKNIQRILKRTGINNILITNLHSNLCHLTFEALESQ
jgi:hypothetical protein